MIRRLADEDLGLLQPLFEATFKHSISLDLLSWKYASGRGESWMIFDEQSNQLIIHCGIYFRDCLIDSRGVRVAQLVDLMARPKSSGLSRSHSPFALLMQAILGAIPRSDNPGGIALGFPSDRAMKLGERTGVYRMVDQLIELQFDRFTNSVSQRYRLLSSIDAKDARSLSILWNKMAADLAGFPIGVRDTNYFHQRYFSHPEKKYSILMVESAWLRRPVGVAVIGPGVDDRELLDMVCAWEDIPCVVQVARRWSSLAGCNVLRLSISSYFAKRLASIADRSETTQFRIMGNPFSPPEVIDRLENRWWLTGGDTDYR